MPSEAPCDGRGAIVLYKRPNPSNYLPANVGIALVQMPNTRTSGLSSIAAERVDLSKPLI